jgi:hypothetical protein
VKRQVVLLEGTRQEVSGGKRKVESLNVCSENVGRELKELRRAVGSRSASATRMGQESEALKRSVGGSGDMPFAKHCFQCVA